MERIAHEAGTGWRTGSVTSAATDDAQPEPADPSRRPSRREVQKAETRRRLLEAATEVFVEQGPMTASLEEIAARAGVSRPTLIFHFGTRADLMDAVAGFQLESFRDWGKGFRPQEFRPYVEAFLRAQADPVVRLVWTLGTLVHPGGVTHGHPDLPNRSYQERFGQLEERVACSAGVSPEEAHRRVVLIAPALLMTAQRAAQDLATEDELREFVDTVCAFALGSGSPDGEVGSGPTSRSG
jgi:AcrR family transcriptional regulator